MDLIESAGHGGIGLHDWMEVAQVPSQHEIFPACPHSGHIVAEGLHAWSMQKNPLQSL